MTREQRAHVFAEGMAAHRGGKALDANPYVTAWGIDQERAFEWELGWCAARDDGMYDAWGRAA